MINKYDVMWFYDETELTSHNPPNWTLVIAACAANQLMTVGMAERTVHHERRVQVSVGAQIVAETVFTDGKSETALKCVYRYRKMLGIEMEG